MNDLVPSGLAALQASLTGAAGLIGVDPGLLLVAVGLLLLLATLGKRRRRQRSTPTRRRGLRDRLQALFARPAMPVTEDTPGLFSARAVLNAAERSLHRDIESLMPQIFPARARLLSQVSMAEFLYAPNQRDWWTISGKRVDFLIVGSDFQPICAIEYQGAGHHGPDRDSARDARRRDWEKRRALRLGNVPLIEVPAQYDRRLLIDRLGDVTGRRPMPQPGLASQRVTGL